MNRKRNKPKPPRTRRSADRKADALPTSAGLAAMDLPSSSAPSAAPAVTGPRAWGTTFWARIHARRNILFPLLLVLAGATVYANSLQGVFVFDDSQHIADNPAIRKFWPPGALGSARPLLTISLALNYALGGLDVTGYHVFNIAVHLCAGLALFGLLRRTLRLPSLGDRFANSADKIAFAAALVWVVHPLQTQAVTYIVQRCEALMALFFLLTLYCYLRAFTSAKPWRRWLWCGASFTTFCLGLSSKEVMVTVLPVLWLYDRCFLADSWRSVIRERGWLHAAFLVPISVGLIKMFPAIWGSESSPTGFFMGTITPWDYARSQPGVILHYLRLAVWPYPQCLDYGWPVETRWLEGILLPSFAILALIALSVGAFIRGHRIAFLGAAFFLILAPTSSFAPIQDLCVEHRMYLPLACVVVAGVLVAHETLRFWARRTQLPPFTAGRPTHASFRGTRAAWRQPLEPCGMCSLPRGVLAAAALVVIVAALGFATFQRNRLYHSAEAIWGDVIAQAPGNPRAYNNLGALLLDRQPERARQCLEAALRLAPSYAEANRNYGLLLAREHRFAEARDYYLRALSRDPGNARARVDLAACLIQLGRFAEAADECRAALQRDPGLADAHVNLSAALAGMGRTPEAIRHAREALRLEPRHPQAHATLGQLLATTDTDEALRHLTTALATDPESADIAVAIANLIGPARPEEAIAHYHSAIRRNPRHAEAHYNLANTWVRLGFPDRAISHLQAALLIRPAWEEARQNLTLLNEAARNRSSRKSQETR